MNRRTVTGVVAGVLGVLAVAGLVIGAYRAGEENGRDERAVTRVVDENGDRAESGEVVRVVDDHQHRGPRHGGFFLFPLAFFGLIGLLIWTVARRGPRDGHRGGYGPGGWHGPGSWYGPDRPDRPPWFDEWHRRAHETGNPGTSDAAGGSGDEPGPAGPGDEPTPA